MYSLYSVSFFCLLAIVYSVPQKLTVTQEVFFDVEVKDFDGEKEVEGNDYRGRFVIGIFGDIVPMTALNFVSISKGYSRKEKKLHYKNTTIHRIVPDFVLQMGDVTENDGSGGLSIFGEKFDDETFELSHRSPGWVSMANSGKDTNNSQFFILLTKARWLDSHHVVFGKVVRGMDVIKSLGEVKTDKKTQKPISDVTIVDCGLLPTDPYDLKPDQLDSEEDL